MSRGPWTAGRERGGRKRARHSRGSGRRGGQRTRQTRPAPESGVDGGRGIRGASRGYPDGCQISPITVRSSRRR
jgi:hypothetical protein